MTSLTSLAVYFIHLKLTGFHQVVQHPRHQPLITSLCIYDL